MKNIPKKKNKYPKWIVWSGVLIGAVSIFYVMSSSSTPQQYSPASNTNAAAPQFTLTDVDGHPITLSNYRGKVVILFGHHGARRAGEKSRISFPCKNSTLHKGFRSLVLVWINRATLPHLFNNMASIIR
jgi:hypothetical protein